MTGCLGEQLPSGGILDDLLVAAGAKEEGASIVERNNLGHWLPGRSANPGGRPKPPRRATNQVGGAVAPRSRLTASAFAFGGQPGHQVRPLRV